MAYNGQADCVRAETQRGNWDSRSRQGHHCWLAFLSINAVGFAAITHLRRQLIRLPIGHQVEDGDVLATKLTLHERADVWGIRAVFAEVRCAAGICRSAGR